MNPVVEEWVRKAEGDFATACREFAVTDGPNFDAVCFHYQQCVEKYLKAFLIEKGESFPKTHDLAALLDMCLPSEPGWASLRPDFILLSRAAVEFRYPGDFADVAEAQAAKSVAEKARETLRGALGIAAQ